MSDHVQKTATGTTCILNGIRRSYDAKFKLMVLNYEEKTNNCNAERKFSVVEANIRRGKEQKQKLLKANSI